jgi:peptidoglycan/LPS O-acetylase OafA/YrhL
MKKQHHTSRNHSIDLLRGISIVLVILNHCFIHMPFDQSLLPKTLFNVLFYSGHYAVVMFFVVSGFLITGTSLKREGKLKNLSFSAFYQRRIARIVPCLLVLLLALAILDRLNVPGFIIHNTSLSRVLFAALTFRINWLESQIGWLPGNWDILWTLSVEEVFYLFFPLACWIFRMSLSFILLMIAFIIAGPFPRVFSTGMAGQKQLRNLFNTHVFCNLVLITAIY